ncbi:MAG: hypothetical protein WC880_02925 [Candidatus Paceibacterota bacterium]
MSVEETPDGVSLMDSVIDVSRRLRALAKAEARQLAGWGPFRRRESRRNSKIAAKATILGLSADRARVALSNKQKTSAL